MKTFTQIKIPPSNFKIDYNSNLFFLGSCFAENISKKFNQIKFNTYTNPFGVTYNPLSIERQILNIIDKIIYVTIKNRQCTIDFNMISKFRAFKNISGIK